MDKQHFINNFRDQFDFLEDNVVIVESTDFRSIEDWDSLVALSVIAMADEDYNVELTGDDIRGAKTVDDLYQIIKDRHS